MFSRRYLYYECLQAICQLISQLYVFTIETAFELSSYLIPILISPSTSNVFLLDELPKRKRRIRRFPIIFVLPSIPAFKLLSLVNTAGFVSIVMHRLILSCNDKNNNSNS